MRESHVSLESVWERLVRAVKEGSKQPSKSLKGSKLRRTSNLTFLKSGLKLHTKKQWSRLSLRTIEYATNTNKKYFNTFWISQITFTYGERKKERPYFYGMFSQICRILLLSPPYWKWSYHNATGVTTSRATSEARKDQNTSSQRGNKFNTSYRDISVIVAEKNSVVMPKY